MFNKTIILDERFLKKNFSECARDYIGSLENTLYDYDKTDTEYISAKNALNDFNGLVDYVLQEGKTAIYDEGFCGWGSDITEKLISAYNQYPKTTIHKWAVNAVKQWIA